MLRLLSPSLPDLQVLSCPERGRGGVKMMLLVLVLVLSSDVGPGALGLDGLGPDGLVPGGLGLGPRDIGLGPGGCELGQIKLFLPTL